MRPSNPNRLRNRISLAAVCGAALLASSLTAQTAPSNVRYQTGLLSAVSHEEVIVRVTELEGRAGISKVQVLLRDRNSRIVARGFGTASSRGAFEFSLPVSDLSSRTRELLRVEVVLSERSSLSVPVIHVEFHDPFDLTFRGGPVCNAPGAAAGTFEGSCDGVWQLVTP